MPRLHSIKSLLLIFAALLLSSAAQSRVQVSKLDPGLSLHCPQSAGHQLDCQLRLLDGSMVKEVSLAVGDRPVTSSRFSRFPQPGQHTAIMLVIDLGPDMPIHANRSLHRYVHQLLEAADTHHRIGLAAFVDKLQVISPVGVPTTEIEADLASLRTSQHSSSLFGVLRETINMLSFHGAQRRAIVLFSNGNSATDQERYREVVDAAIANNVPIISVSFTDPDDGTEAIRLRQLSAETGGRFINLGENSDADVFFQSVFQDLDSGGSLHINLATPEMANVRRGSSLLVSVHGQDRQVHQGMLSIQEDTDLPGDPSTALPAPAAGPGNAQQELAEATSSVDKLGIMAYVVLGIGLFFIIGGILLLMRRPASNPAPVVASPGPGYLLHLSMQDQAPVKLDGELISIGRNADNDIRLNDSSVSRHHAHIQRRTDGNYTITDLDSLNGIYINNRQIKSTLLTENDELEIGDIRLRFTLQAPPVKMLPDAGNS